MAKPKILVVEDDRVVAEDIKRSLQNFGYAVPAIVATGKDAVKKAEEYKPDLVLMDIVLRGEMDGIEAADQIRSRFNFPAIYLTAYSDEKRLERAKITEPFGYIIKPFEDRELHTSIEMALYKHGMEKRLKESEEWLSRTLRSIGDAVIATDRKGCMVFMNPAAQSLTGWKQEEAAGKPMDEVFNIINEETGKQVESPVAKAIREGIPAALANHTLLIAKDGKKTPIRMPVLDSCAPITDEKGDILGCILVFCDFTTQKKIEEEKEEKMKQVERLNELFLGREHRMVELKREVNSLLEKLGQPPKYETPDQIRGLRKEVEET